MEVGQIEKVRVSVDFDTIFSKYKLVGALGRGQEAGSLEEVVVNNRKRIEDLLAALGVKQIRKRSKDAKEENVHASLFNNEFVGLTAKGININDTPVGYQYATLVAIRMEQKSSKRFESASNTKGLLKDVSVAVNVQIAHFGYKNDLSIDMKNAILELVHRWKFDYAFRNSFKALDNVKKIYNITEE
jgi:hypothetical protein